MRGFPPFPCHFGTRRALFDGAYNEEIWPLILQLNSMGILPKHLSTAAEAVFCLLNIDYYEKYA